MNISDYMRKRREELKRLAEAASGSKRETRVFVKWDIFTPRRCDPIPILSIILGYKYIEMRIYGILI